MKQTFLTKITIPLLWSLFILFYPFKVASQEHTQINPILLSSKWNAQWITYPDVSLKDYGVFHFRKTFNLSGQPDKFVIHISGDNRYRLFINGTEVCKGPARGDLAHWHFETIDIASHLKTGKNVLAAVVWNFGEYSPLAQMTNKTALIVQGDSNAEEVVNTGTSWKVYKNEAYTPIQPSGTVVGPGEDVDGPKYPYGWESVDYNDSRWKFPLLIGQGVPYGKSTYWDWSLISRKIPFMEYKLQRINEVERAENIVIEKDFLKGTSPIKIPANKKVKILCDQTYLTTAYPELVVSAGKGSIIEINYAEALVDENRVKGNRNQTQGKKMLSLYTDKFHPDGKENRRFQPLWFRTYRYLELTIETGDKPLIINDLYGYFTAYPFEEKAYFKSSDPGLQSIWDVSWRTARLCAGETYYDCPYYEQLQYIGDTRIQALISLYMTGDDRLMRNAIEQFNNSLLPSGLTLSRYPCSQPQVIPPFSLIWIYMVHDFHMHRDDRVFVKKQLNGVRNVLYWYKQQIADNGMLGPMDWWNFVDWSFGPWVAEKPSGGTPKGAMDGYSSIITLQYINALQKAAELFDAFNDVSQADQYRQQARSLIKNTRALCWAPKKGLLADTPEKTSFSQHANVLAILTGMFDKKESSKIINKLLTDENLIQATFYFKFYLIRAMIKTGKGNEYLTLLDSWKKMIDIGLTTFAETPEPTRSDCHAWSAHPNYDLVATVCGIIPASPGFQTVNIEPHMGDLEFVECKMPHPKGDIILKLKRIKKDGIEGTIVLPDGLNGKFRWNGKEINISSGQQKVQL